MCSSFYHMPSMENYQGDLGDIVRAGGGAAAGQSLPEGNNNPVSSTTTSTWQFPDASDPMSHNHNSFSEIIISDVDYFGDPFSALRDPLLLHELGGGGLTGTTTTTNSSSSFFSSGAANASSSPSGVAVHEKLSGVFFGQAKTNSFDEDRQMKMSSSNSNNITTCNTIATRRPNCNFFSRMLQITPNNIMANKMLMPISPCHDPSSSVKNHLASPREILNASSSSSTSASSSLVSGDMINANASNSGVQQILSPRNPAIKRRKSQAKKVVCIPAPAPANSRPSGEVVPSDLWAWRKYGQKPIKGSPYPRGYYRCSSSKGCSARKQVERSRTDPNMLVITYTSEHNHPWPTQRNALAGSTRSQPSKTNIYKNPSSSFQQAPSLDQSNNNNLKEDPKEMSTSDDMNTSNNAASIKEETGEGDTDHNKEQLDIMDGDSDQFNDEFTSYKPTMPSAAGSNHSSEDFFAELGEIEADSIDLLLNPVGFTGNESERYSKQGLDPFSFLDWPSGHNNMNTSSSVMAPGQEAKRGL